MTIDERIASELGRHAPKVDEQVAWDRIQSAAMAKRRRRRAPILATAAAATLVVMFVGLVLRNNDVPTAAEVSPAQIEAIRQTAAAANSQHEEILRRLFAEGAEVDTGTQWGPVPLTEPDFVDAWMYNLGAWGFEGEVTGCRAAAASVDCEVRARWHTLSSEAVEEWSFVFDGDLIRTLTISRVDLDPGDRLLPLGLGELDDWEDWLEASDPATAHRLIPDVVTSRLIASFLRYDPTLADEIGESIQKYLNQRSSPEPTVVGPHWEPTALRGVEINVTPDLIQLGQGLVAQSAVRAENNTYVLAGLAESEQDILFDPEFGVLAAFDGAGVESWRIQLDGTPLDVVTLTGDLWVSHGAGTLSRIDSSDGRVISRATIGETLGYPMVGAFRSVWVQTRDTGRVVRVYPDLATTSVELPLFLSSCDGDCPSGLVVATGAVWLPLGSRGVAAIDSDTNQVTVIPVDGIGHSVERVAVDDDVVFVASVDQVTSIVDGEVVATASTGRIRYLGRVEGVFGVLETTGRFDVLGVNDPMVVEVRETTSLGFSGVAEVDGEAWAATGPYTSRRVQFLREEE